MSSMLYNEAKKREDALANFLKDIVSIPSLSSQEGDVVKFMAEAMKKLGYDEVKIDGMGNLLGRIGDGPRVIAFDGHCDTVDVGDLSLWDKRKPYPAVIDGGKVYGRGTSDQKGGVASSIYGVAMLKELGLVPKDLTIWVVASVQEEDCDGLCWQYIVKEGNLRPEVVVSTEPTSLQIYHGHRGRMELEIETKGVSCHGSAPERGVNAVYKMADIIKDVEKLNESLPPNPPLGKGTITISHIRSTSPSLCAVADSCTIHLDRRLGLGETEETVLAELKALPGFQKAGAEVRVLEYAVPSWTGLTYPTKKYYPTWHIPEEAPSVQSAVAGFKDTFGEDPVVSYWVFSTNGVSIAGMFGIPVIGFGPGHEKFAHFPNEEIDVEHLTRAAAFYAGFAIEYAKTAVPAKG
jgi:putative selenium metabolism hydrolase